MGPVCENVIHHLGLAVNKNHHYQDQFEFPLLSAQQQLNINSSSWIRLCNLSIPSSSSPRTPSDWSKGAPNPTGKNFKRLLLPQQLVSQLWDSSDSSSNSFTFPSTTSSSDHNDAAPSLYPFCAANPHPPLNSPLSSYHLFQYQSLE